MNTALWKRFLELEGPRGQKDPGPFRVSKL